MITNQSSTNKRCKITNPVTIRFRIDYENYLILAPGLSRKIVVYFCSEDKGDYFDNVIIEWEGGKFNVELKDVSEIFEVIWDNYINLGIVKLGTIKEA